MTSPPSLGLLAALSQPPEAAKVREMAELVLGAGAKGSNGSGSGGGCSGGEAKGDAAEVGAPHIASQAAGGGEDAPAAEEPGVNLCATPGGGRAAGGVPSPGDDGVRAPRRRSRSPIRRSDRVRSGSRAPAQRRSRSRSPIRRRSRPRSPVRRRSPARPRSPDRVPAKAKRLQPQRGDSHGDKRRRLSPGRSGKAVSDSADEPEPGEWTPQAAAQPPCHPSRGNGTGKPGSEGRAARAQSPVVGRAPACVHLPDASVAAAVMAPFEGLPEGALRTEAPHYTEQVELACMVLLVGWGIDFGGAGRPGGYCRGGSGKGWRARETLALPPGCWGLRIS
jgi:hypothetical protein